MTVIGQCNFC